MRKLLVLLLVALTLTSVVGWAAKKYEGETMQVYAGMWPYSREFIVQYIGPALKEKWGIDLAVEEMGSKVMLEKVIIARDNPTVTICGWDDAIGIPASQMGLTAPIDLDLAPNLADLYDWAFYRGDDGEVHVLMTTLTGIGLLYNTEIFESEGLDPPTGWDDLWRPDLAGRVGITFPESNAGMAALLSITDWQGGDPYDITPGIEKLKTLLPNLHSITLWSSELVKLFQLGEIWMAPHMSGLAPSMRAEGFPIAWVGASQGIPTQNGGMSIIKDAPYQDVAHDFINLFFSLEYMTRRVLWGGDTSPNQRVWSVLSPVELANLPLLPADFNSVVNYDWGVIDIYRADWIEMFHRELE